MSKQTQQETAPGRQKDGKTVRSTLSVRVTTKAFGAINALDETLVGTPDYMGIAYFWNWDYRHSMRELSSDKRCRIHDGFIEAGLELGGTSEAHLVIIKKVRGLF